MPYKEVFHTLIMDVYRKLFKSIGVRRDGRPLPSNFGKYILKLKNNIAMFYFCLDSSREIFADNHERIKIGSLFIDFSLLYSKLYCFAEILRG